MSEERVPQCSGGEQSSLRFWTSAILGAVTSTRQKILTGAVLTDAEWAAYLAEAHDAAPGMTPRAFATFRTAEGKSSYEILASVLDKRKGDIQVVDLGCGDGFLLQYLLPRLSGASKITAVDMVSSELERARSQYKDKRIEFVLAGAQSVRLPPGSVDAVLCHLTLMLMRPIDPVVASLSRLLKPGGEIAAVIAAPIQPGTAAGAVAGVIGAYMDEKFPGARNFAPGDQRFRSEEGLQQLFGPQTGFQADLWVQDFEIRIPADPETVWMFHKDMYLVGALSPEA
ncbi:MAG TPA: class I SAM-dependent methyltransferase, partial [Bdellovibrionota bacterium]|nr:class I SAM-dependent methyltransferase [Bdellovibrionota bacterium]